MSQKCHEGSETAASLLLVTTPPPAPHRADTPQMRRDSDSDSAGGAGAGAGEVGRMVDSSQADDRRMIRLVKERRLLYARNNMPVASYYTQVKSLWQEVADEMGWSVADVRRKWSHIRNSYSRHLRNETHGARTGKGRMVSRWYLADELDFLREHMATDTRLSPYSTTYAPTFLEMDLSEQQAPEPVDVKPFIYNPWLTLSAQAGAGTGALDAGGDYSRASLHNEDSSSSQAFGPDETSSYFQFFRGIYNDYQELSARKQRLFKRKCLNFLHELLDEEDARHAAGAAAAAAAVDLSSAHASEDERDQKLCIVEKVEPYSILPNN